MIAVSEFFYSLQGEGKTAGHPAIFLRLGGCNLLCGGKGTEKDMKLHEGAQWRCDTIEVWRKSKKYTSEQLYLKMTEDIRLPYLLDNGVRLIITGGEPLLQQIAIIDFLQYLESKAYIPGVEIETNGTILPLFDLIMRVDQWNVSPKLPSSGADMDMALNIEVIEWFAQQKETTFKFVIVDGADLTEVRYLADNNVISRDRLWLMPAAGSRQELLIRNKLVAEFCKQYFFKFTTRLQLEIWDKAVGV